MFTGIITSIGRIKNVTPKGDHRLKVFTDFNAEKMSIGSSIACSGVCLTVVETGNDWFSVSVSQETLSKTTIKEWTDNTQINLERSLKFGDEMGGHIVSGHIDGIGLLENKKIDGESIVLRFEVPESLKHLIAKKGSIAIDGVSLTVNNISGTLFSVNIIQYTCNNTTLGSLMVGDPVNIEIDTLARYVAKYLEQD